MKKIKYIVMLTFFVSVNIFSLDDKVSHSVTIRIIDSSRVGAGRLEAKGKTTGEDREPYHVIQQALSWDASIARRKITISSGQVIKKCNVIVAPHSCTGGDIRKGSMVVNTSDRELLGEIGREGGGCSLHFLRSSNETGKSKNITYTVVSN